MSQLMSQAIVPNQLKNLLADIFDVSPDKITPELAMGDVETWDSFGHVQAILAIEAEFGIQFDPNKIPKLTTVALLTQELKAKGVSF